MNLPPHARKSTVLIEKITLDMTVEQAEVVAALVSRGEDTATFGQILGPVFIALCQVLDDEKITDLYRRVSAIAVSHDDSW
jgi:hypothetical protein